MQYIFFEKYIYFLKKNIFLTKILFEFIQSQDLAIILKSTQTQKKFGLKSSPGESGFSEYK